MSKVKSGEMPHYELLYLISNKFSEHEIKPIIEKVNALILNNQGKITLADNLGKKRLSYPIKSFRYGYYILAEFDMVGKNVINVDRALRMMNEILRHQIIIKTIKTAEQIVQDKKIAEKIAARNIKEEKRVKEKIKETDKEKVDLKDLDEKLDKILETNDLL
ncbi:30S ribosomal protein S6 [Patescibacteria group bacterium]|nr:30S ribosomal protein S6 [Patescibacteria group bacterium]MBU1663254.1 30S ribosomal protein S6 [Patescibacteria group bacterium]MBU1934028.1 30S ribosomal protein S6 [Patescibacteria group bacterium]MBU2007968.1 30S ribosomal protein S6 [Patescibacteria group bacterium]MBU2264277.1 30S ribosomal protein S6 [Patescibacteria group bacterium]